MNILGLLEAFDRNGALLVRMPVIRWPVVVGRALVSDLVLDDPHIAAGHLRIDRPAVPAGAPGGITVEVLETRNGVTLGGKKHGAGDQFDWPDGSALEMGRVRLSLRLADAPTVAELPLPHFPWRRLGLTVAAVSAMLGLSVGVSWLQAADPGKFVPTGPMLLLVMLLALGVWAGLWAVANKVFAGQLQFWRHVRIACGTYLVSQLVTGLANLAAFAMSWESLARFDHLGDAVVTAGGIYLHLAALLPRRRAGLAIGMVALVALALPAWLGSQWLGNKRLSNELYMSSLFPPALRLAPAVPVPQFLQEAQALRERLAARLADSASDAASEDEDDSE